MKKTLVLCVFMALSLIAAGCWKDGDDGASGSSGRDALISFNSYEFTPDANPFTAGIEEIDLDGFEAGWQTVTVWIYDDVNVEWIALPASQGDGTTTDYDFLFYVGDGYVCVEEFENGVVPDPPTGGYSDYMVIVQTFAH